MTFFYFFIPFLDVLEPLEYFAEKGDFSPIEQWQGRARGGHQGEKNFFAVLDVPEYLEAKNQ